MRRAALLVALALSTSCLDSLEPDVGPPLRESCVDEDSDPDTDVSYQTDIYEVIFRDSEVACLDCHAPDAPTPIGLEVGGLDLSSYQALRAGGAISGSDAIVPGSPCDSVLLQKISPGPPFGARMPLDGGPFVPEADRQRLHDWIAEGALDN